ncbi:HIT family protein [Kroppenstedtia eburnea]|uniref:HIT family protein n=1 Tax=Kroppenstedtia eburnea TaxID=714067 RepID=UPI00362D43DF
MGHFLIEPKRHIEGLGELIDAEAEEIGRMTARLSRALRESEGAEHVYSFVLGHHIPHLHIHVIPRYPGAPREYWGMRVDEWPDAPRGGKEAIKALCERVRKKLT